MAGLDCPYAFDTDVNAPAMSEFARMPAGATSCAYITVGTGIGVGLIVNGQAVHGLLHPEAGHVAVPAYEAEPLLQPDYQVTLCPLPPPSPNFPTPSLDQPPHTAPPRHHLRARYSALRCA